jgi:hypothetical protein
VVVLVALVIKVFFTLQTCVVLITTTTTPTSTTRLTLLADTLSKKVLARFRSESYFQALLVREQVVKVKQTWSVVVHLYCFSTKLGYLRLDVVVIHPNNV